MNSSLMAGAMEDLVEQALAGNGTNKSLASSSPCPLDIGTTAKVGLSLVHLFHGAAAVALNSRVIRHLIVSASGQRYREAQHLSK